jgi:hypothetical protein
MMVAIYLVSQSTNEDYKMNTEQAIRLARFRVANKPENESSARFCLADAVAANDRGDYDAARTWAKKSLAYSVGMFHKDFQSV